MKKIYALLMSVLCMLCLGVTAFAGSCDSYNGTNENSQNYTVWADAIGSYLHTTDDGKLMRVQYLGDELLVEYYDSSFVRLSNRTLTLDYPLFGGFYATGDYYFVLTGQNNPTEDKNVVCFAVTKYDKSWNKIAAAQLNNCNTTVPFKAGSARFCHSGNYLLVRTSHEMYKHTDGKNHQANVTLQIDMNTMKITDSHTAIASINYGYVSHSFNQFIKIHSDKIVALDHGDAYPRSIALLKYKTSVSSGKFVPSYSKPCDVVDMFAISGSIGANATNCSVGGFEITSTGYLCALNSIEQGTSSRVRNIYLSYVSHSGTTAEIKQLTDVASGSVSTPQLVKISEDKLLVLWYYEGNVNYCTVDGRGNLTSAINSFKGSLSDCQPVNYMGKLIWYVWNNERVTFYSIDSTDIAKHSKQDFTANHNYKAGTAEGTTVNLTCTDCGDTAVGSIPESFYIYWEYHASPDGSQISYSSQQEDSYHPDKRISLRVVYYEADLNDYTVASSDESIAEITGSGENLALRTYGEGTVKITVKSKYNEKIKTQYTVNVSHDWTSEVTDATCTEDGKAVKKCLSCNETKTEIIPASGHKMGSYTVVKEPTCTAKGSKKSTCSVCGFYESAEISEKGHNEDKIIDAVDATCTKQGKTQGKKCSACDKIMVPQETVPALGHNMSGYKITKAPTCTAQGEETATCSRCNKTETQSVARVAHKEVSVKAIAPTCTKQGKTAGKKCSVCGRVTVEQESVEALGHELGEYKITKEPTCTAKGEKTAKCIRCTHTETVDIAKTAHTEVTVKATAPTCTKQGKTAGKKCSVCDKVTVEQESVEAIGHELGEYETTKEPTCTAKGKKTAKCTRCTYAETVDIAKVAHTEVALKEVAPTCTKQGKTAGKKCSVCDKVTVAQESVEALGHELGEYETTKEATCTANGEKTAKCVRCTYTKTASVAKVAHTEVTVKAVKATCTKNGKTQGKKCSVCDKVIVAQKTVDATGHVKKTKVISKATAKANGRVETVCEACGKSFGENKVYRIQTVSLAKEKYTYDGKAKKPAVTVTDYNKNQLVKDKDYTVTYQSGRKNIGTYTVTVKFKGKYSGQATLSFKITLGKPADLKVTTGKAYANISWSKVIGADGYQVYYSTSEKGEYKKLTTTSKTSFKKTKLKSGKKYYFKVRAYKKTQNGTVYGSFSAVKGVKIK